MRGRGTAVASAALAPAAADDVAFTALNIRAADVDAAADGPIDLHFKEESRFRSVRQGERGLAPSYGLTDPSGGGVDGEQVAGLIELCEPDLAVVSVDVTGDGSGYVTVKTNVEWVEE